MAVLGDKSSRPTPPWTSENPSCGICGAAGTRVTTEEKRRAAQPGSPGGRRSSMPPTKTEELQYCIGGLARAGPVTRARIPPLARAVHRGGIKRRHITKAPQNTSEAASKLEPRGSLHNPHGGAPMQQKLTPQPQPRLNRFRAAHAGSSKRFATHALALTSFLAWPHTRQAGGDVHPPCQMG